MDLPDDGRLAGREQGDVAIAGPDDIRHAARLGEGGVFGKMQILAMGGNGDLRPQPGVKLRDLAPARMARGVDEPIAVGDDVDARSESDY